MHFTCIILIIYTVFSYLDSKSKYFTIRIYHGGQFRYLSNENVYVGGNVNYADYCHSDEMSLIELELMGNELGCLQTPIYMYKDNLCVY